MTPVQKITQKDRRKGCRVIRRMEVQRVITHLSEADLAADGEDEFGGIVSDSVFEDDFDIFDVGDFRGWVAGHDNDVGSLTDGDGADAAVFLQEDRSVFGGDVNSFDGGEATFDEELDFALIAISCDDAADASRVWAGQQQSSGLHERMLQCHFLQHGAQGRLRDSLRQISTLGLRGHGIENTLLELRMVGGIRFGNWKGGGDGDIMLDQDLNELLKLRAFGSEV